MQPRSRFARRLCVGVDAAGYGALDGVAQYDLQALLPDMLDVAATAAGLDRNSWQKQPQGDGELALVPPDQPEPRIVDDFIRELDAALRLRNHGRTPTSRLRLRVAIDFGVAYAAPSGFAGQAVVATARLLASDALHDALAAAADASLAVALSATVYQTVADRHTSLLEDQFYRAVVGEKEYRGEAWIRVLPGGLPGPAPGRPSRSPRAVRPPHAQPPPQSSRPASPQHIVHNEIHGPVDAEVIGIKFAAPSDAP